MAKTLKASFLALFRFATAPLGDDAFLLPLAVLFVYVEMGLVLQWHIYFFECCANATFGGAIRNATVESVVELGARY